MRTVVLMGAGDVGKDVVRSSYVSVRLDAPAVNFVKRNRAP